MLKITNTMKKVKYLILGSGYAGMTAGHTLKLKNENDYLIVEKQIKSGGTSSSLNYGDFVFDIGIHGLYSKNENIINIFKDLNIQYSKVKIEIADYFKGYITPHPSLLHLNGFPQKLSDKILSDLEKIEKNNHNIAFTNFSDWCLCNFGLTYCKNVLMPYTEKFWASSPNILTTDWIGNRIKIASLIEVHNGIKEKSNHEHYVKEIYYPIVGGFGSFADKYSEGLKIQYNYEVSSLDIYQKNIKFTNGDTINYEYLIYTLPLKEISTLVNSLPQEIENACKKLSHTSIHLINICLNKEILFNKHWLYIIDKGIPFARLSKPSIWSSNNAPIGKSSLQAEIYVNQDRLIHSKNYYIRKTTNCLIKMGIIDNCNDIEKIYSKFIKYGNIIFNTERQVCVDTIHNYLEKYHITYCGRYGNWDYSLIDEVILDTERKITNLIK